MSELKPCPFCGSDQLSLQHEEHGWYSVACLNPECCINGPWDMGESGAIEAWNTRPLEAQLLEACKAVYEILMAGPTKATNADFSSAVSNMEAAIAAAEGDAP